MRNARRVALAPVIAAALIAWGAGAARAQEIDLDLGDLPPGKAVTVKFRTLVGVTQLVSNQGTITAAGGAIVVDTDDPDTPEEGDATETVVAGPTPPAFSKGFAPGTIGPGSVSTLSFLIQDLAPGDPVTDLAFTDTLPAGVVIAGSPNASTSCGGTLSAPAGGSTFSFSGGSIGPGGSCSVTVDVTSSTAGTHTNISEDLTSSAGNSGAAMADLTVSTDRPGFAKSFSPSSVPLGTRSRLTLTIDNSANGGNAFSLAFTDPLPSGLVVADPPDASNTCLGVLTAVAGSDVVSLGGGAFLSAGATCAVGLDVVGTGGGALQNVTGELTSIPAGSSGKASATLDVTVDEVALIKSFTDDPVPPGGTATLEFTIQNFDRLAGASGLTFSDDLDAALSGLEAVGPLPSDPCGSGSSLTGTSLLTLTGGSLPAEGSCTFSVTLQVPAGAATGGHENTTSELTGNLGGVPVTASEASDRLFVEPIPILTKTFTDDPVGGGETVTLEFTVQNSSAASSAADITFQDVFFSGIRTASVLPTPDPCGPGSAANFTSGSSFAPASLVLSGGNLEPGASCTFSIVLNVEVGVSTGIYPNTTTAPTATVDGETVTGKPASDDLVVVAGPILTKSFTDDPVDPGDTVTLEFTLSHLGGDDEPPPGAAEAIAFSDDLGAVIPGLAAVGLPMNDVCGLGSEISGTTLLSLTGGSLAPGATCSFSVTLAVPAGALAGNHTNTTSPVTATVLGVPVAGFPASDVLRIAGLELSKSFTDDPVVPGASVTLEFTIDNTSPVSGATDISFSDDLDDVLSGLAATGLPLSDVCGVGSSLTGLSGNTLLVFQDGSLLVGESCTFSVTLQVPAGAASGAYLNTTQGFSATVESTPVAFDDASDSLVVDSTKLLLAKSFTDDPVAPGEAATLEFTLTNLDASEDVTGIAFSDDLDAALSGLAATGLPMNDVCGAGSQISGTGVLSLTGGSLAPGASCSFSVDVVVPLAVPLGTVATNTTSGVTGTMGGLAVTGDPASDQLQIEFLTFAKAFDAPTVAGGTAMLTFTLQNLSATTGVGELGFTDDLSAVLPGLAAVGLPADDVCGAGSQLTGTSFLTLTAGTLGPSEMCSFGVTVQVPPGAAPGSFTNVTSSLLSAGLAAAAPAMAALIVEPPPAFAKSFAPDSIDVGDTSTLSFTIDNSASALAAAGLDFTDVLPAGVVVANPANAATTCTGGTLTAVAGSDAVSYSGGAVAAGAACGVSVDVVGSMAGVHVNTTGDLTSSSGNSGTATDTLTVNDAIPPRVVSVDSVLGTGDGQLAECEGARVEITQLLVSFDEPMSDPPGDTDLNDVTNPANYLLVGAGPDGDFATTGCGPTQGDDLAVAITGAAYAAGSSTATLSLGVAPALRDDLYRLFVCSELQDLGGNQLDGDGNGLEGDDFVRLFRMERTNSLVNGHFDCDLEGWDLTAADPGDITWDANDADGSAASGSAHVTNLTGSPAFEVSQCVPASASRLPLSGAVRVDSESVTATLLCRAYSEPACAGTLLDTAVVGSVALGKGGTAGVWEALSGELVTPAGTQSARCGVEVIAGTGAAFDVFVDSLVLGSRLPDFKVFRAANPPATPDERSRPAGAEPGATGEVTPR